MMKRVLVIESNTPQDREQIRRALNGKYEVVFAQSHDQIVNRSASAPDVVIVSSEDERIIHHIRQTFASVPILVLGEDDDTEKSRGLAEGEGAIYCSRQKPETWKRLDRWIEFGIKVAPA